MKKIFTLLFSVGAFATSFAQTGSHQNTDKRNDQYVTTKSNADFKKFDDHRDAIYTFTAKERDMQINRINYDFNLKVKSIINNRRTSKHAKQEMIQKAQKEKAQQFQIVNAKFNSKFNSAFNNSTRQHDNQRH